MAPGDGSKSPWKWVMWTLLMGASSVCEGVDGATTIMGVCMNDPAVRLDCYPPVENFPNVTEEACLAQGCCWKPLNNSGIPCAFDAIGAPDDARCSAVPMALRVACRNPRFATTMLEDDAETCASVGCCFDDDASLCFQPFFEGYELLTLDETDDGWRGTLVLRRFTRGPFGNDVPLLELHVIKESSSRVRIRITDPSFPRYEVQDVAILKEKKEDEESDIGDVEAGDTEQEYKVHFYKSPFGIAVTRRETDEVLFNSTPSTHAETSFNGLIFENQYLELSTRLESHDAVDSPVLYGLGERWGRARLRADRKGDHYPMFSRRAHEIKPHTRDGGDNLGGVHPFYLQVLDSGHSHGVFFLSSNAMEVVTQDDALVFRSTGGVLDFFIFAGPTAQDVTREYTEVVGRPEMPPVWALGYHFGKRGHHSLEETMLEVAKLREVGVPLDAYWQDVDYMSDHEPFTLDGEAFPLQETQAFIDDLHFNNQYYIVATTPAIPTKPVSSDAKHAVVIADGDAREFDEVEQGKLRREGSEAPIAEELPGYLPLERGMELDVFVKGVEGERYAEKLVGHRWSTFVDFFHPNSTTYWREMLHNFRDQVLPFDGVWMDSNEPSATCDRAFSGQNHTCDEDSDDDVRADGDSHAVGNGAFVRSLDIAFPFDPYRQPFTPGQSTAARGGHGNLNAATLPMASLHHSSLHYNVHSLYGHAQAKTTRLAIDRVLKRRSLVLSRATYSGDGQFAGHLSGDFDATWKNLQLSIANVIQMNLLGLPLSGPSIGGNGLGMKRELSIRWHQAASFFPLVRSHASKDADPQSAVDYDQETATIVRETLLRRYRHLPYLYTQFYRAHVDGQPIIRGLAMDFPSDPRAYDVETQYLVGPSLMVSPAVDKGAISTRVYFPNATWFDLESGRMVMGAMKEGRDMTSSRFMQLLTPIQTLQVHVRGGSIVPTQQASTTTAITKRGSFRLVIALDPMLPEPAACGELFVDDGDSLDSVQDGRYSLLSFEATLKDGGNLELTSKRAFHGYDGPEMSIDIEEVVVFGLSGNFYGNSSLHVHSSSQDDAMKANYFEQADMLVLSDVNLPIGDELKLSVEARNAGGGEDEAGNEPGGEGGDEAGGGGEAGGDQGAGGDDEAHGEKEHKGRGEEEEKKPEPAVEEQHHKKHGLSGYAIAGIVAGVLFLGAIIFTVVRNRRHGYQPIAG